MKIKNITNRWFLILFVSLIPLMLMGNAEIEPPDSALEPPEPLDQVSRKQLDYFLEISSYIEKINSNNFFKPYDKALKHKISRLLEKSAEIEPDECFKQYLSSLSFNVLHDNFQSIAPEWYNLEDNKVEIIFWEKMTHRIQEMWLRSFFQFSPWDWDGHDWKKWRPFAFLAENAAGRSPRQEELHRIFDTFIYINDIEETQQYNEYTDIFDRLQDHVPEGRDKAVPYTPIIPQIKIAHLVYTTSPNYISVVFPPQEIFAQSGRFKIVLFKNLIDAYVQCILKPISSKIIESSPIMPIVDIDCDSYLSNLVMYKITHHIGPVFLMQLKKSEQQKRKESNLAKRIREETDPEMEDILKRERTLELEEAKKERQEKTGTKEVELKLISEASENWFPTAKDLKASVISIYNTSVLIENGLLPQKYAENIYTAYLVSLIDKIRKDANGRSSYSAVIQFNYLLTNEAIRFNIETNKISLQPHLFTGVMEKFAQLVIDKFRAPQALYGEYGKVSSELSALLDNLDDIPKKVNIDINTEQKFQTDIPDN